MNKKGQGLEVGKMIGLVIAVFVLVIIALGIYSFYGGQSKFFDFLPSFGEKEKIEGVQVLGYDITNDKVQYYDGSSWRDFKESKLVLDNKEVVYSDVRENFRNYFFQPRTAEIRKNLADGTSILVLNIIREKSGSDSSIVYPGEVSMSITKGNDVTQLSLRLDNSIYILDKKSLLTAEQSNGIKDLGGSWRDSALKSQIIINYQNIENDLKESVSVCATKVSIQSRYYLVVDLTKGTTSC